MLVLECTHQVELIIIQKAKRVIVRCEKTNIFIANFKMDIPKFSGVYYLGGVPANKMPERCARWDAN